MLSGLNLDTPFPSRNAAGTLSQRVVAYLCETKPEVGSLLLTDADLASRSRLSHSTVRRALRGLHKDGWIERRPGYGSLVGPRVHMSVNDPPFGTSVGTKRLAVIASFASSDWYVSGVLNALDQTAYELGLTVEIIASSNEGGIPSVFRRLMNNKPDVVAMISPRMPQAVIAAEALRLNIPVLTTGSSLEGMGMPVIREDSLAGAAMAVTHLVRLGHTRIGFLGIPVAERFMFIRRQGWQRGQIEAGIEPDEGLVCWITPDASAQETASLLSSYLAKHKPTALLVATTTGMACLGDYSTATGLRIPQDLSVVTFDQSFEVYRAHFGSTFVPTVVGLPLADIAKTIAKYAMIACDAGTIPAQTELSCSLIEGASVRKL